MRKATVSFGLRIVLKAKGLVASTIVICLLTVMNPASAHSPVASPGTLPVVHDNGHGFATNFHHLSYNPLISVALTPADSPPIRGMALGSGLPGHGYNLDLSSTSPNIALGTGLFKGASSATIDVGGTSLTVHTGDTVTPGEFVAIQQVRSHGAQSITLTSLGAASGGFFSMNQAVSHRVGDLVIPQGVTAIDYFSGSRVLGVSGDLTNYGSIYGVSTNSKVRGGLIAALDINNEAGGLISTNLAGSGLSISNAQKGVDLTLAAVNSVNNAGTISSSRSLTVATAYGSVINSPASSGVAPAVVKAARDVNLLVGSGNLNNAGGVIKAVNGNVNIVSPVLSTDININGAGGAIVASNGNINVRDASYSGSSNMTVHGGDYLSNNLNLYAGSGEINADLDQVSGRLNTSGNAAHVLADTNTLTLGSNVINGDPTYANTGGDIVINGAVVANESIAILASGNIIATGPAYISTANASTANPTVLPAIPNTNVTLVAGATVTTSGSTTTGVPAPGIPTGTTATVDFSSGSGGNIDLSKSTFQGPIINTSSNLAGIGNQQKNGGNVLLAAVSTNATNGRILLPAARSSIDTSSASAGGTVTILAGNPSSVIKTPAISVGNILTAGGASSGLVFIRSRQPAATSGTTVTFNAAGDATGGSSITGGADSTGAIVFTGTVNSGSAAITISTSGTGSISQTGTGRLYGSGLTLTAGTGGIGLSTKSRLLTSIASVTVTSGSNVFLNNLGSLTLGAAAGGDLGTFDLSTSADGSGNGRIIIGGTVHASSGTLSTINLNSTEAGAGDGGIRHSPAHILTATTVNLTDGVVGKGTGDIGSSSGRIETTATFLSARTQGSNFLKNTGPVTVLTSAAGNAQTFDLLTAPDGSSNGSITLSGSVKSAFGVIGTINLTSTESGAGGGFIPTKASLVATTVNLEDLSGTGPALGTGNVGTALLPITVTCSHLSANTNGLVNIKDLITTGVVVDQSQAGISTSFTLVSSSGIAMAFSKTLTAGTSVTLTAGKTGGISLEGTVASSPSGGSVDLTTGSGSITGLTAVAASSVVLTSKNGAFGAVNQPLRTFTTNLSVNGSGFTNIQNESAATLNVTSTLARNVWDLSSQAAININSSIPRATALKIVTSTSLKSASKNIFINGSLGSNKSTNTIEVENFAGGGISVGSSSVILAANRTVSLSTDFSDIGAPSNPININAPAFAANTGGGFSSVHLNYVGTAAATLLNSASVGAFQLTSAGSLTLTNLFSANGTINVVCAGTLLQTSPNSVISVGTISVPTTAAETLTLENSNAAGSIVIGANSSISTFTNAPGPGNGTISISVGPAGSGTNTTPPANVVSQGSGGSVFFGTNSITANAPTNHLTHLGANIVFNTGALPASHILLGGNVTMIADPPDAAAAMPNPGQLLPSLGSSVSFPTRPSPLAFRGTQIDSFLSTPAQPVLSVKSAAEANTAAQISALALPGGGSQTFAGSALMRGSSQNATASAVPSGLPNILASVFATTQSCRVPANGALEPVWLSETELANGRIPALIFSDEDLGLIPDQSIVVELEPGAATAQAAEFGAGDRAATTSTASVACSSLAGGISKNIGADKFMMLKRGSVVLAPSVNTIIETPFARVNVNARSLVLVMSFARGAAIFDLDDSRGRAVQVSAGGRSWSLVPGSHVVVTENSATSFEEVNPAQLIGYRRIVAHDLGDGLRAFTGEFSVLHAISTVLPLRQLIRSNQVQAKKVANHLLKTTAVVMQMRGARGEFKQVLRPVTTAWAQ